jgi:predicted kinase
MEKGFHCLNADSIRFELYGDEAEQGDPKKVFEIFFERLEKALSEGKDIIVDNTNLKWKHRKPILERAEKAGYKDIQLWLLDVPLDVCLERNKGRERAVSEEIVANMFMEFNRTGRPKHSEGKLVLLRPAKEESGNPTSEISDWRFFFPQT